MFDCIIVGGRCAGASLSMLLSRMGYRVLCLEKAVFPHDKTCTHMLWPPGVAALHRWGLWPQIEDAGPAICHELVTELPGARFAGPVHAVEGIDYTINLRRSKLDTIFLEASRAFGTEVRQGVVVEDLLYKRKCVNGVRCRDIRTGKRFDERARIVVGADGRNSLVARRSDAIEYNVGPSATANFYAYFDTRGEALEHNRIALRRSRELLLLPSDEGLAVASLFMPIADVCGFRRDLQRNFSITFQSARAFDERVRNWRQVTRIRGAVGLSNLYRRPFGPGWALVGDASYQWDSIRAQGINEALIDAEAMSETLDFVLSGSETFEAAMSRHENARNRRTRSAYQECLRAGRFERPTPRQIECMTALMHAEPDLVAAHHGIAAGSVTRDEFLSLLYAHRRHHELAPA